MNEKDVRNGNPRKSMPAPGGATDTVREKIILIGKPNSGKSLLFNKLTGLRRKVANFAGVTVDLAYGKWGDIDLVDFPGTYSMNPVSAEEDLAVRELLELFKSGSVRGVICVLDATLLGAV